MEKWEYKITGNLSEEALNKLGAEGWELVGVVATTYENDVISLYLKRRTSN